VAESVAPGARIGLCANRKINHTRRSALLWVSITEFDEDRDNRYCRVPLNIHFQSARFWLLHVGGCYPDPDSSLAATLAV
jgi:hypothetical protein